MTILTVGTGPDEVHRALGGRVAPDGGSTEAEVCNSLAVAVTPQERMRMGDALAAIGLEIGLADEDVAAMESRRDLTPAQPLSFD